MVLSEDLDDATDYDGIRGKTPSGASRDGRLVIVDPKRAFE